MWISQWLQVNAPIISIVVTLVLVIVTTVYVYITKRILDVTIRQSNLTANPVIGIRIGSITIGSVFGPSRRNLDVEINLTNVGNAPAIEVLVDAEIILRYSKVNGKTNIPARFEASMIPFIRPGEQIEPASFHDPCFGNLCITHLFDDFREMHRLNEHRIATDPTQEAYGGSSLKVFVYYKNNLGQHFLSTYWTELFLDKIPSEKQESELKPIYVPRPEFHAGPISEQAQRAELEDRNRRRELSGW